jgi:ribose transport system ATP-binding protein
MIAASLADAPPVLELDGIEKSFPGAKALKGVSFSCRAGEIHCLLGENGAGKSTLMRIVAGVSPPDAGRILIAGEPVALRSPRLAQNLGIAMVYQDTRLVPDLDVAQNIWLGREPGGLLVDRSQMEKKATEILTRIGARLPLTRPLRDLAIAERQTVEIARALAGNPSVLILDEPTSALDSAEIERLFEIVRSLKAAGTAIIFISHRLPEVFAIADRITVLKDGAVVGTVERGAIDGDALVSMMVGRQMAMAYPPRSGAAGPCRLELRGLSGPGRFRDVSFAVRGGEIVGLGGIQGNGQSDVVRSIFGLNPHHGEILLDGTPSALGSPARSIAAGVIYVPGDRHREGLFLPHSIRENISLPHLRRWAGFGVISGRREAQATSEAIARFAVKTPSAEASVSTLSGGNQQKVVLGRWTEGEPRVFIFEDPTRGVDVATKLDIYRRIRSLADAGAAVVLVASDLMELIGLSDRILIFSRGRIVDEVRGEEATEERIVGSAVGAGTGGAGPAAEGAAMTAGQRRAARTDRPWLRRYGSNLLLACLVVLLGAATASQSPYFFTGPNLANLAEQIAPLALVALGQLAVILLGGIDLSVGPLMSLVTCIVSYLAVSETGASLGLGVAASLGAGLAVGLLNALLILRFRIPDLIATLATYSIVLGAALTVRPSPGGTVSDLFLNVFDSSFGGVPAAAIVVLVLTVIFEVLLVRGRLGQRLYATGSSEEASFVVGIRTDLVRAGAYIACALAAALAGLLIAARIGSGDPQSGSAFTLTSITAVVIGGANLFGGRGTAVGALLGAIAVGLMQNALNLMHVSAYYQYVWAGALTLIAVVGYALRRPPSARA